MQISKYLASGLVALTVLGGGSAYAANMCQAGRMTCATTMPVDGYCECTAHGATISGTVVPTAAAHRPVNSTAGGCGVNPNGPGCR